MKEEAARRQTAVRSSEAKSFRDSETAYADLSPVKRSSRAKSECGGNNAAGPGELGLEIENDDDKGAYPR